LIIWEGWNLAVLKYRNASWPIQISNIFQNNLPQPDVNPSARCIPDPFDASCLVKVVLDQSDNRITIRLEAIALASINRHNSPVTAQLIGARIELSCGSKKIPSISLPQKIGNNNTRHEGDFTKQAHKTILSPMQLSFSNPCGLKKIKSADLFWEELERSSPGVNKNFIRTYKQKLQLIP
jgi:hypothetical protein